ncbi:outer membrane beta-barrel protein [Desulfogranum mediterraneum]|uniref:outer membrane beta-barrel protein n=1 Tax=Desulfogranum mediterraneum TaxID=160661 RepID=UPI000423F414|nr:outer membrane beta-barrel protein [Desulfogranum mediterraneum]
MNETGTAGLLNTHSDVERSEAKEQVPVPFEYIVLGSLFRTHKRKGGKRMKKKYYLAAAVIGASMMLTGMAIPVQAAQSEGDSTLQLSGSFNHSQGADVGTVNLDLGYGYFVSANWELGIMQSLGYSIIDDADDQWVASTIPYVNYHFRGLTDNDTFQPFIGAFVGASYNENDTTGTLGPQVGFKSFVNDSTYIMVKYRYEWFFDELSINEIEDTSSDGNHVVTLGVGFVF